MKNVNLFLGLLLLAVPCCVGLSNAQAPLKTSLGNDARSSPAFAEVILRRTELEAELESLLVDYTEDYPKIKDLRLEVELLKIEKDKLMAVKPAEAGKLTLALGKLIVGKVSNLAILKKLQAQYQDGHPAVRKAKKMVEIYEKAISEILN